MKAVKARYVSDIPAGASERELSGYRRSGHAIHLRTVEYRVGKEVIGKRLFEADGSLFYETPLRDDSPKDACTSSTTRAH